MRHPIRTLLLVLLITLAGIVSQAPGSSAVIVAHPDTPADTIDRETLARIFQGKHTRWDDGSPIVAVMLKRGPVLDRFVTDVVETTPARFRTYWKQAVFTGRGIPPKSFDSELELMEFVAANPGAVGFVGSLVTLQGVKQIQLQP